MAPLRLGARWIETDEDTPYRARGGAGATSAYVTRLHVRYDAKSFPEDLVFLETRDRENFQGRYVLRHPWTGTATCAAAENYRQNLIERAKSQAANLALITGWSFAEIEQRMTQSGQPLRGK